MAPTDNAQKISRLDVLGLNDLEGLKKEKKNQGRPELTSHKPSDDEVSFSLQNLELQIYGNGVKEKTYLYLLEMSVYIAYPWGSYLSSNFSYHWGA